VSHEETTIMTENPHAAGTAVGAVSGCCGSATDPTATTTTTTTTVARPADTAGPCCGTAEAAAEAGACCDPTAKAEAIDAGTSCCGAATESAAEATSELTVQPATEPAAQPAAQSTGTNESAAVVSRPASPAGQDLPVVVVGAGPVGLAAAAHLRERGLPFLVLEAGGEVGASVREWGQVRLFSPWRYDIDHAARRLLDLAGWDAPDPDVLPTGAELIEGYLQPLAKLPAIAPYLRLDARVVAISRLGVDRVRTAGRETAPFVIRLTDGTDILARAVIDASGTWTNPNVLGANGLPAHGEPDAADRIDQALPDVLGTDRDRYAGRHTVVVGSGHSAATTLLALAELADQAPGTMITWAIRSGSPLRAYGGEADDALPARGALGSGLRMLVQTGRIRLAAGFAVHTVRPADPPADGRIELASLDRDGSDGGRRSIIADRVVAATGYRPDHTIAAELRLDLDPILGSTRTLAPLIDPNVHSCGTVRPHGVDELAHPEPGYYAVGVKSYGRAPTFLLATGYEQVRSIAAALAGDWTAARDVQLDLPETGVCSTTLGARAMLADAAARFGLADDIPAKLIAAATAHLPAAGSIAEATRLAAVDLGIDPAAAQQIAVLAGNQFDQQPSQQPSQQADQWVDQRVDRPVTADGRTELVTVPASGGCCG
jgi:glycine/D-amino acid oxidase-like deaminating enzyme